MSFCDDKGVGSRVKDAHAFDWLTWYAKLIALLDSEIDQKRFEKTAGHVADAVFRDAVNGKLDSFEVTKTMLCIVRNAFEERGSHEPYSHRSVFLSCYREPEADLVAF